MKGTAPVSLSQLSKVSPNKRKSSESRAGLIKPRAIIEKGNPDWPCPSSGCPAHIKTVKKRDGGEFGCCDHRILNKSSCQVTTTILQASDDHPKFCQLCDRAVGGTPTLGEPTDEKDDRGYTGEFFVCLLPQRPFLSRNFVCFKIVSRTLKLMLVLSLCTVPVKP